MIQQSSSNWTCSINSRNIAQEVAHVGGLPSRQILSSNTSGYLKEFSEESCLIAQGSTIDEVFLILRGLITISLFQETGPSIGLYVSGPGTMVDTSAVLDPPVSPVNVNALTDVETLAIPREVFVHLLQQEPTIGYETVQALCTRLSLIALTLNMFK